MERPYTLYAWPMSLYSGKTRAYLRYKDIPFREVAPSVLKFRRIVRETGAQVIPVVVTPQGEWLQDTTHIMDQLEARVPDAPVLPYTPRQRITALLLEAWGDEFWLPAAMHYRWSFPENHDFFRRQAGDHLLPGMPRALKDRAANTAMQRLHGFLPGLGVREAQIPVLERWTEQMLDNLEEHFSHHAYLLGSKPSVGDFGLIGPLFAHLGRDPWPLQHLIAPRPNLAYWIRRMQNPPTPREGEFLPDDQIPATLVPLLRSVFREFWPYLIQVQEEVTAALPSLQPGRSLRRSLNVVEYPLADSRFLRAATPYSLWMAQRAIDVYTAELPQADRASVQAWMATHAAGKLPRLEIRPRLERVGLKVRPVATS